MKLKNVFMCMIVVMIACTSLACDNSNIIRTAAAGSTGTKASLSAGITLDCARRYYSVSLIKKYIDFLSKNYSDSDTVPFLQLHFTDNWNVGIVCNSLGQNEENAIHEQDGSYRNPDTGRLFLGTDDIREILEYAQEKNVEIVPEIDMPAHMEGFYKLAEEYYGAKYAKKIFVKNDGIYDEIRIDSAGIKFARKLYKEYAGLFASCSTFHIGCDEYQSASVSAEIKYINAISAYLNKLGFSTRIWNDMLFKENYKKLRKNIEITYWSFDGDVEDEAYKNYYRSERASADQLVKAGYNIYIYNSYYLYYVPSESNNNIYEKKYMADDIKRNWSLKKWD